MMPSSVVIFRKEKTRQPASQWRSSMRAMRMAPSPSFGPRLFRRAGAVPGCVPVAAQEVEHAAVALEKLIGKLEDRQHHPAFGRPGGMTAAGGSPHELARPGRFALVGTFTVDEAA